jgi:hypothetical protein
MKALIIAILLTVPAVAGQPLDPNVEVVKFDMVEVNIYHNEWASPKFAQVIFWDWHQDNKLHVEYWQMMKDAFLKTQEGKKEHDRIRYEIADKSYPAPSEIRREFLKNTEYRGDFVGGRMWPQKDYKKNVYKTYVWHENRLFMVITKQMKLTCTQHDPERDDREFHPGEFRKGLIHDKK